MVRAWVILAVCAGGCVSMAPSCKLQQRQFNLIREMIDTQRIERPPATPAEAERLSTIYNVAAQGSDLARVNLKRTGQPQDAVPSPDNLGAVKDFTERYEAAVDAENVLRERLRNFAARRFGLGDVADGAPAGGALLLALLAWWKKRKSDLIVRQYDDAIQARPKQERRKILLSRAAREAHEKIDNARKEQAT